MLMNGPFPETFVSILLMQDASLSRAGKSLVQAGAQVSLGIAAAAEQMERLSGPMDNTARQDVPPATDVTENATDLLHGDDVVAFVA